MPTAVTDVPVRVDPPRKRWTGAECEALWPCGILEAQRIELVEGDLVSRMGRSRPHVVAVTRLYGWLREVVGERFMYLHSPIDVAPEDNPINEPQPDLIVLTRDFSDFDEDNPGPQDLQLVVEVADTTLGFDLSTKAALYARAGIVEYWVLDIVGRRVIVHREPQGGRYAFVTAYSEDDSVAPLAAPASHWRIGEVFPR